MVLEKSLKGKKIRKIFKFNMVFQFKKVKNKTDGIGV